MNTLTSEEQITLLLEKMFSELDLILV